jgi:sortase (surface protein transpeptidase)
MRRFANLPFVAVSLAVALWALAACRADQADPKDRNQAVGSATAMPAGVIAETMVDTATAVATPTAQPTPSVVPTATATRQPATPTNTPTLHATATDVPPTNTSTPEPTATPMPTVPPRVEPRLIIPALNVDAVVVPVGLDANGAMAAPEDWFEIGWFRYGPRPGFAGSAALAGHLDTGTGAPATFWDLNKLAPGQEVVYQAEDGSRLTFVVDEVATYPWDEVPLERVFARSGEPRLALITCGGQWSREHRNYSHRTIVYASLP